MQEISLKNIRYAYFLGIGGIGMSAIARYFHSLGIAVAGYDKTPSSLTLEIENEGIAIHYDEDVHHIPEAVLNHPDQTLFVVTPAIPSNHKQLLFIQEQGWGLFKRSEVLGLISRDGYCIAVAGTHGKTTTSTMIAHILCSCGINVTAFLGGISANYNTNYIHKTDGVSLFPDKPVIVLEADEFDRSFHRLTPDIAVITAIDPDHLDIYHTPDAFHQAFSEFAEKIRPEGKLIYQAQIGIPLPAGIHKYTYALDGKDDVNFKGHFEGIRDGYFRFSYSSRMAEGDVISERNLNHISAGLPGFHNMENATAAIAVCMDFLGLEAYAVKDAVKSFKGARRRFEYIFRSESHVVIDDYAHHPGELNAIISSVRELYPDKKLTIIFQPHLFTRTRDFAEGFADSLARADELILMDIYPARELPLPGITSDWLLGKIEMQNKKCLQTDGILEYIRSVKPELLLIAGAGDIDRMVPSVQEIYENF